MTQQEYQKLIALVTSLVESSDEYPEQFDELKKLFEDDIASRKRFSEITTIANLLRVLDLRGTIHEADVSALKKIAKELSNDIEILKCIDYYEQTSSKTKWEKQHLTKESKNNLNATVQQVPNSNRILLSPRKKELIYTTLEEEIGRYWRELGLNLGIRENRLIEIDSSFNNTMQKASKILEHFEYSADSKTWFHTLCEALEESKRRDLAKELQKIMMMNE